jgi:hypothetical protein
LDNAQHNKIKDTLFEGQASALWSKKPRAIRWTWRMAFLFSEGHQSICPFFIVTQAVSSISVSLCIIIMIINMVFRVTLDELFQVRIMKTSTSFILLTVLLCHAPAFAEEVLHQNGIKQALKW